MCAMCTTLVQYIVHLLSWVANIKTEKICSKLFWTFRKNYPRKNFNVHSNCSPTLLWPRGWQELSHTLELIASWCNKFTRPKLVTGRLQSMIHWSCWLSDNTISSFPNDLSHTWPGYEAMFQSTFSDFFWVSCYNTTVYCHGGLRPLGLSKLSNLIGEKHNFGQVEWTY